MRSPHHYGREISLLMHLKHSFPHPVILHSVDLKTVRSSLLEQPLFPLFYPYLHHMVWQDSASVQKKAMILFFLITQMLPSTLVLTSLYIMFSKIGLLNTYWAPILADATLGILFSIIILRTYFLSIPKELDEAANIDGCGHWKSFFLIMLPIAKPGVVVVAVFSFVYAWGDLIYGITFITNPNMRPITSSIYNYVQQYQTLWNSTMAFGIIAISPVVLIFIFMQRYIVSGLTNGAVKA